MVDSTLKNIIILFALSFKAGEEDPTRNSFDKHYMAQLEIKDLNRLIYNKPFCD